MATACVLILMLLSSMPGYSANNENKNAPFDLDQTLGQVDNAWKEYEALKNDIDNKEKELDDLIALAKACKISGLDLEPYKNQVEALRARLDALKNTIKELEKIVNDLKKAERDVNQDIKDKNKELKKKKGELKKKQVELKKAQKDLANAIKKNPKKIREIDVKIENIYDKIWELEQRINRKKAKGKDTSKLEAQLAILNNKLRALEREKARLADEPRALRWKVLRIQSEIEVLKFEINSLNNEIKDLKKKRDKIRDAIGKIKKMGKGIKDMEKELANIDAKLAELEELLKKKKKDRGGEDAATPNSKIGTGINKIELPGSPPVWQIWITAVDQNDPVDEKEKAENCLFEISKDGDTWYVLELDLNAGDGFEVLYETEEPGVLFFKIAMCNWYGNIGYDHTEVILI